METEDLVTPIELAYTGRGQPKLIMNGYMYTIVRQGVKVLWRCNAKGCKGRAVTYSDFELSMTGAERGSHTHLPDPIEVEKQRAIYKVKSKFLELEDSGESDEAMKKKKINTFVKGLLCDLPPEVRAAMPKIETIKQTLLRLRKKKKRAKYSKGVTLESVDQTEIEERQVTYLASPIDSNSEDQCTSAQFQ